MFASDSKLAFDLDQLKKLRDKTESIKITINEQRNSLITGLIHLRKDWRTPAGDYFFRSLDADWENNIDKFLETMERFNVVLNNAITEFEKVVDKANSINHI